MQPRSTLWIIFSIVVAFLALLVCIAGNHKALCRTVMHDADELEKLAKQVRKAGDLDVILCGEYDIPLLHRAAGLADDERAIGLLLDAGADIEIRDRWGSTPLMSAIGTWHETRKIERIRYLLARGADVHATNDEKTVLHFAAEAAEAAEIVVLLISAGAEVTDAESGKEILDLARANESVEVREAIARLIEPTVREKELQQQIEKLWSAGTSLPPGVRKDKEMVALTGHLKNERYWEALAHFEILKRLEVELDPSFDFYHGEALILTGHDQPGLERLSAYIDANGPEATHYTRALTLIAEGETENDAETIWQRDDTLGTKTRRDKYLLALTQSLEGKRHARALVYFDLIERLEINRPASFDFYHGEALLRTGDAEQAIKKLIDYIRAEKGAEGQYYTRALELVNEAEQM